MGKLIYSMGVSLDGYIAGPDGSFDWSVPSEELHRFHNERVRELGGHLLGRNLYETMRYWETADRDPELGEVEREFAAIWLELPKVVCSTTLADVEGNTRLVRDGVVAEVERLKAEEGGDLGVGGAGLAATLIRAGLVDEFEPFVHPVITGGGTPFLPDLEEPLDLELVGTRTFDTGVVFMRYRRSGRG
ncbi:MAG: dihydrofolate reductase family protein [Solirubrobacterales bacterium]